MNERLKKIKEYMEWGHQYLGKKNIAWLIEQAEQAEQLRKALEFYADPLTHEERENDYEPPIYHDNGAKARKALEENK